MNPFGSAMSNFIGAGNKFVTAGNYFPLNNAVTYVTPNIAGWTFHGQYSFANTAEGDYVDADDRYMAAAARYKQGAMTVLLLGIQSTKNMNTTSASSLLPSISV